MKVDNPLIESVENDVTPVLSHRRANPRVQELLDLTDDGSVRIVVIGLRRSPLQKERSKAVRTETVP